MRRLKVGAFLTSADPLFGFSGQFLHVRKWLQQGIPAIGVGRENVAAGSLFSHGPNLSDTWRQAGVYIGRILKGEKPSELPIVQPHQVRTSHQSHDSDQLGIDISPILLARADEVIE
jgi:putative tryptophan/tyrosine transport system substrate-binding protein